MSSNAIEEIESWGDEILFQEKDFFIVKHFTGSLYFWHWDKNINDTSWVTDKGCMHCKTKPSDRMYTIWKLMTI